MNERLKRLRKTLNLTQQQFADRLNVGRNNIAGYETGKRSPSDAAIALICREFSVSTQWLREGIGEMFIEQTQDEQIVSFIGNIQRSEADSFKKQLLSVLANLTEEQWKVLAEIAGKLPQAKQGNGYGL
ncbi:MAG: helix-turn-helix domain-containing protein [Lachnospiraceae bacterium]|jgi:HTH-type transcriptional regulator/antitoxin PezA|nr:helix-turn-helix domain-containing protein [Lachnospiraceae bacterium]